MITIKDIENNKVEYENKILNQNLKSYINLILDLKFDDNVDFTEFIDTLHTKREKGDCRYVLDKFKKLSKAKPLTELQKQKLIEQNDAKNLNSLFDYLESNKIDFVPLDKTQLLDKIQSFKFNKNKELYINIVNSLYENTWAKLLDKISSFVEKQEKQRKKQKEKALRNEERRKRKEEEKNKILKFQNEHKPIMEDILSSMFTTPKNRKYIIHCGKTNSGKTYNAIEALKKSGNGVYLAPLRLLAWEVSDKLNESGYICSLITGEEQIIKEGSQFISSTIEMLDYNTKYKCIVIDEAFMVYDADRGKSWTKAILEANADEVHIILSEEALNIIVKILDSTNRVYEINKYDMLQKFKFAESPTTFGKNLPKGTVFVVFSRRSVILNKTMLENLGYSVSMLYGNLPPEVKKNQINRFINKETDLMVTTDVIGMGINLPVHALVFLETTKFDGISERKLNTIEVKQIAGRTGRYGISNENSFVSAKTNGDLRYITETYNNSYQINNAYIGFDYKMFMSFDENMSIINRIDNFKNIDFIPNDLRDFIYKESTTKYSNIAELVDKNNFTLDEKYIFLNAPVKENNKVYFEECVKDYNKHNIIKPPLVKITNDTKSMEDNISKMELYLNLCRNLNHDVEVFENFKTTKYEFIEILDKMLLDKTLMSTKTCKLCDTKLSITHPYSYCENCYQTKIRSEYNNDHDVYDRYDNGYRNHFNARKNEYKIASDEMDDYRNNALGIGTNKLKRRLNKIAKTDALAKAYRIAFEAEDKHKQAQISIGYEEAINNQKNEQINSLIELFKTNNWKYGKQYNSEKIIYFDIPNCEQIFFESGAIDMPKYENKVIDSEVSVLDKLLKGIEISYPQINKN